ncbi:hypothetical protein FHX52_0799 [Humibacillus xanthopallidus]|uniref:Uncharacterized protein n=1 Tax=Humibacillus xanthopallidus TaxID=412689 RepID=A0A543PUF6_9MICO|nr:hypothetical protein [Humibacillus xanthopallidus]TQN47690.1 hypothetical protein FHX52_0799 [Humibacillus xanthopallidus]
MTRATALASHLPPLYREGELVDAFNQVWGVHLDGLDEVSLLVQRAHWIDVTRDFDEAAAIAALLDIPAEEFHNDIDEFRAWVHAITGARLQAGSVTREALRIFVDTYTQGFQRANAIDMVPGVASWQTTEDATGAALVENPHRFRSARLPAVGGWEPLARLSVTNAGIDPVPWAVVLTGQAGGSEYAPFIANRATGQALAFRGEVRVGQRLTIAPDAADPTRLRASVDGTDMSHLLDTYAALVPGPHGPGTKAEVNATQNLALGVNELWFLPLAHYQTPGLGRFLLALADDALRTGRFDETLYDHSIFAQHPQISASVAWVEHEPASFEIRLPAQVMRTASGGTEVGVSTRERLEMALDAAVDRIAGVGIATDVVLSRYGERQPGDDRLVAILPRTVREVGPTGGDLLRDSGALFDVTGFDESVLR